MNDDSFPGGIDIYFLGPCDVKIPEITLELLIGGLQVKQSLQKIRSDQSFKAVVYAATMRPFIMKPWLLLQ